MPLNTALAMLLQASDKPAPDTSTLKIICVVLIVILVGIIIMRRKSKKKSGDEDEF
jgi:general stress protein CsbA